MSDQYYDEPTEQEDADDWEVVHPSGGGQASPVEIARVNALVEAVNQRLGFGIGEDDPEYGMVPWQTLDGDHFLDNYNAAMARKARRLGVRIQRKQPAQAAQPKQTSETQRVTKATAEYVEAMNAAIKRGAGATEKRQIRENYRIRGVDVDTARQKAG